MFRRNNDSKAQTSQPNQRHESGTLVKYAKPKILLIDMDQEVCAQLTTDGYKVSVGSFGKPYLVTKGVQYEPVIVKASLPNYTEQEIIVIDLAEPKPLAGPQGEKSRPDEELDWWAKCSEGVIDPRPIAMTRVREPFDRILCSGGVFIIFSNSYVSHGFAYASMKSRGISISSESQHNNWQFLSAFSYLGINNDDGEEICLVKQDTALLRVLSNHLSGATFHSTIEPLRLQRQWGSLAENKYGSSVAGFLGPVDQRLGWIFVFPQLLDKAAFLSDLLKDVLTTVCPELFPFAEGQQWVHSTEYEQSTVLEKVTRISEIKAETAVKISELESAIANDRSANEYLYDLMRGTGRPLVLAVLKALGLLGFSSVVDVDEEMKARGTDGSLREDLRIHDTSPILVVDVKGVAGHPSDPEALQAQKHAFIYVQEQNRADVRGLTIINHQRLIPPLDRDSRMPFRKEILDNAAQVNLGLMTTWDLFRLVRAHLRYKWSEAQVKPIFYRTGRIEPIPTHYSYAGTVKHVWQNAFSVLVEDSELQVGDTISIEFPVDFEEQKIESLQLDDVPIDKARVGDEIGIHRNPDTGEIRPGLRVFRVS